MGPQRMTREQRRQLTRNSLLDAAAEVFSQRGFHAASVDEIAEAAGFSKGAVYSNFATKEELFLALFDRRMEHEVSRWGTINMHTAARLDGAALPEAGFSGVIQGDRTWNLLLIEFFLYAMRDDQVRQKLAARFRELRHVMQEQLQALFAAQGITPLLPASGLPWIVFALGTGLTIQAYLDPDALPTDLYERALAHLLSGTA